MQYLLSRLQERSTWLGLIALATGFGVSVKPEVSNAIITVGSSLAGVVAALTPEPPRVCRRPFGLSYAAMAGASSMA
jgi:hypothetical protein